MGTDTPYPNGLMWRVQEMERRVGRMEEGAPGTITGDVRQDIRDLRDEVVYLKRSIWGLIVALVGLTVTVFQVWGPT